MKLDDTSILHEFHLDDREIARRKSLFGFSPHDARLLAACRDFIEGDVDRIVTSFYRRQVSFEEIAILIGDQDALLNLMSHMKRHVLDLFSGAYDGAYVSSRLRAGLQGKPASLEPKYQLASLRMLREAIAESLGRRSADPVRARDTLDALDKLLLLDIHFVIEACLRRERRLAERAAGAAGSGAPELKGEVLKRVRDLEERSRRDPLTGLHTRRAFTELLAAEIEEAQARGRTLAMLYLGLEEIGQRGDPPRRMRAEELLQVAGALVLGLCGEYDLPCRIGEEELCLVQRDGTRETAEAALRHLEARLREIVGGMPLRPGVAVLGPDSYDDAAGFILGGARAMLRGDGQART